MTTFSDDSTNTINHLTNKNRIRIDMNIGTYIKNRREALGLTQTDLSDGLGLSTSQSIYNIECGKAPLPIKHLSALSIILQVSEKKIVEVLVSDYRKELQRQIKSSRK